MAFRTLCSNRDVEALNQQVVGLNKGGYAYVGRMPLKPPSAWTHFKAAISNLPALGNVARFQRARDKVITFDRYTIENRKILGDLKGELTREFGSEFADMTVPKMNVKGGAPLSLYNVAAAYHSGDKHKTACQARNNQRIEHFFDVEDRAFDMQDMTDVYLARGNKEAWPQGTTDGAAKFIRKYVQARCEQFPNHANGHLGNDEIVNAANEALALYEELKAVRGMTEERLGYILGSVAERQTHADRLTEKSREDAIMDKVTPMLDRKDANSLLRQKAQEMATKWNLSADALPDAVLKSIQNSMEEQLRYQAATTLPKELACSPDASSIIAAVMPKLAENVGKALDEHCAALKAIDDSETLNSAQKSKLKEVANTRRMDPVQIAEYEKLAARMNEVVSAVVLLAGPDLADLAARAGNVVEALKAFDLQFGDSMAAMGTHGNTFWESGSLAGSDFTTLLNAQVSELTSEGLAVDDMQTTCDAMNSTHMKSFLNACDQAGFTQKGFLGELVYSIGVKAGGEPSSVELQTKTLFKEADSALPPQALLDAVMMAAQPAAT